MNSVKVSVAKVVLAAQVKPRKPKFNLETAVGQVRVYVFLAFWQGVCRPARGRRNLHVARTSNVVQRARKMCNRACSVFTKTVSIINNEILLKNRNLIKLLSGQLPFLGLIHSNSLK